jgi:putative endonuclease
MKAPCVYLLASRYRGTLYVGVTSNLAQRISEHRLELADGFTKKYGVKALVWHEPQETMEAAIGREKNIKVWKRAWKIALIERSNPNWTDLFDTLMQ